MLFKLLRLPKKFKINAYLVIDLTENSIHLPNGKSIPMDRIISIDTDRGIIIYRDEEGHIKEEPYTEEKTENIEIEEKQITAPDHTASLIYA